MADGIDLREEVVRARIALMEELCDKLTVAHGAVDRAWSTTGPEQLRSFGECSTFAQRYLPALTNLENNVAVLAARLADAAHNLRATAASNDQVDAEVAERLLAVMTRATTLAETATVAAGGRHTMLAV